MLLSEGYKENIQGLLVILSGKISVNADKYLPLHHLLLI